LSCPIYRHCRFHLANAIPLTGCFSRRGHAVQVTMCKLRFLECPVRRCIDLVCTVRTNRSEWVNARRDGIGPLVNGIHSCGAGWADRTITRTTHIAGNRHAACSFLERLFVVSMDTPTKSLQVPCNEATPAMIMVVR